MKQESNSLDRYWANQFGVTVEQYVEMFNKEVESQREFEPNDMPF